MKKLLSFFLCLALVMTMMPATVFAGTEASTKENTIHIYLDEKDITGKTVEFSSEGTKVKRNLVAKTANGDSLDVTWKSSDPDRLTIDENGQVYTNSYTSWGKTVTVTAETAEGENAQCQLKLMMKLHENAFMFLEMVPLSVNVGENQTQEGYFAAPSGLGVNENLSKLMEEDNPWYFHSSNEDMIESQDISAEITQDQGGSYAVRFKFAKVKQLGKTVITMGVDQEYAKCSANIQVSANKGVMLSNTYFLLEAEESAQLTARVEPSTEPQEIEFTSEDPKVATVDENGVITGVSTGVTNIVATQKKGGASNKCKVSVIKEGIYLVKGGVENYMDYSCLTPVDSEWKLISGDSVYVRYYSKADSYGDYISWYSSNSSVIAGDGSKTLTPRGNGTAEVVGRWIGPEADKPMYAETARFKVTVDVPGFKPADTDTRESYGPQGADQTTLEMTGLNISTNPTNEVMFENYINTLVDRKAADFSFTVASSAGDGGAIEPDNYVKTYMLDHIKLYQKSDLDHPIATFDDGGMQVTSVEADTDNNPTSVDFSISEEILDFDTEYVLLFDNGFRLNHELRKDVAFFFKTDAFTKADSMKLSAASANLAVNGEVKLSASFSPQNADDTKLTWTSSDPSVASVDKNGTVRGIKAGTAVITAKNENGLSAECKVTVAAVKVAAASIKASATDYNAAKLSWKKPAGTTGTELYRSTSKSGTYKKIAATTGTSYRDKGLDTGKRVYYKARVYTEVNGTKYYSAYSNIVSVKPTLAKVQGVKANPSYNKVKITYKRTDGANGYVIYRAARKNGKYKKLATVKGNKKRSYTNKKLKTGKRYYYKVRAYRNVGKTKVYGSYSRIVKAKTALKTPSMKVKVRSAGTRVSWKKTAGADKYQLYRSTKKKGGYILIRETVKTSFTDTGARAGKTYYYKLRAYKKADGKKVYSKYTEVKKVRVK